MHSNVVDMLQDFSPGAFKGSAQATRLPQFEPLFIDPGRDLAGHQTTRVDNNADASDGSEEDEASTISACENHNDQSPVRETIPVSEHDIIIADLQKHHADLMEDLVSDHRQNVMVSLIDLQEKLLGGLVEQVENSLGHALLPLMNDKVQQTNLEAILAEVTAILKNQTIEKLKLSGPMSLITPVEAAFAHLEIPMDVEESDTVDLTVTVDKQLLSTSLSDWSLRLKDLIEQ